MSEPARRDCFALSVVWGAAAALFVATAVRGSASGFVSAALAAVAFFGVMAYAAARCGRKAAAKADAAPAARQSSAPPPLSGKLTMTREMQAATLAPLPNESVGVRPELYAAAPARGADDLKMIKGVGPKLEALLNRLGVWRFDQIAGWSAEEVAWIDDHLEGFKGRVARDDWVAQAQILAEGGETEFSLRVAQGDVPTSQD
jgi:NADH-quinone oxidoreductase subunit E